MPSWISQMKPAGHGRGTPALSGGDGITIDVDPDDTANTKGLWAEILADVGPGCMGFVISARTVTLVSAYAVDIAIGSAGNEVIIASNIPIEWTRSSNIHDVPMVFPIRIPDNARVSARCQSAAGGAGVIGLHFNMFTGNLGPLTYSGAVCESVNPATSRGAVITSTGIFELVASASRDYKGIMFMSGADGGTVIGAQNVMEYFVGAAASEKPVYKMDYRVNQTGDTPPHFGFATHRPIPYWVQATSRWSTRANRANIFVNNCMFFF